MKESVVKVRQYLLSGVSFAIPFIACGGIMIAAAIAVNTHFYPDTPSKMGPLTPSWVVLILNIGVAAFTLMPAVLAGYIANAMAGKPGLVPGFVGGWLATHIPGKEGADPVSAGFLGAMIAGLVAGYVVMAIKKLPVPKVIRPIMPIMIIPILGSTVIGILMLWVIGIPIANSMDDLNSWLNSMSHGSAVVLAIILGCMIAFDMGGPINKTAFFFGSGMIAQKNYAVMGAVAAAICTPPMGLGLATIIGRKLWSEQEREAGTAALAMGCVGITEGAIPFAASDPLRVIPCIMLGSAVSSVIAMLGHVGDHAPHGGPIVIFVTDNKVMYVIAIAVGVTVTAVATNLVKQFTTPKVEEPVEPVTAAAA